MRDDLREKVDDAKVEGWELHEEQGEDRVVMIKRKTGSLMAHIILFILVGWWTIGIANGVYLGYKYFIDVDKRVLRSDQAESA